MAPKCNMLTLAALKKSVSGTCLTPHVIIPSPTPGKMYELLPWPGMKVFPFTVTGLNGLPLANTQRP